MHDLFGQGHLAGEVGIVGGKPKGAVRGLGKIERITLLDSEPGQRRLGENDAGRCTYGGYLETRACTI